MSGCQGGRGPVQAGALVCQQHPRQLPQASGLAPGPTSAATQPLPGPTLERTRVSDPEAEGGSATSGHSSWGLCWLAALCSMDPCADSSSLGGGGGCSPAWTRLASQLRFLTHAQPPPPPGGAALAGLAGPECPALLKQRASEWALGGRGCKVAGIPGTGPTLTPPWSCWTPRSAQPSGCPGPGRRKDKSTVCCPLLDESPGSPWPAMPRAHCPSRRPAWRRQLAGRPGCVQRPILSAVSCGRWAPGSPPCA